MVSDKLKNAEQFLIKNYPEYFISLDETLPYAKKLPMNNGVLLEPDLLPDIQETIIRVNRYIKISTKTVVDYTMLHKLSETEIINYLLSIATHQKSSILTELEFKLQPNEKFCKAGILLENNNTCFLRKYDSYPAYDIIFTATVENI